MIICSMVVVDDESLEFIWDDKGGRRREVGGYMPQDGSSAGFLAL